MSIFSIIPLIPQLENAACRDYAFPDLFFPVGKKQEEVNLPYAKAICSSCVEASRCLEFALEQKIEDGIWAGTTPDMRSRMKPIARKKQINALTVADRIRELFQEGKSPQQIALLLNQEVAYVNLAISRKSKFKGEIQLSDTTKNLSDGLFSSSESA
jgi:WhiB family redox-sensing transcriptional regulator